MKAEYGISYSQGFAGNVGARNWSWTFNNASSTANTTPEIRKMDPADVVPLFHDDPENFLDCWWNGFSIANSKTYDKNLTSYVNLSIPFKIGSSIEGSVKLGGMYREKKRTRDDQVGTGNQNASVNVIGPKFLSDSIDWITLNQYGNISAVGLEDKKVDNFLGGDYNFGYNFNMDRMNQMYSEWMDITKYYSEMDPGEALPIIFDYRNISFIQAYPQCMINDQDIKEKYTAAFIMPEFNITKYVMFMPGLRWEHSSATMKGFYALPPQYPPTLYEPLAGDDTSATRSDDYLLPMIHLRIKPTDKFYAHFSYTKTLSRPDFNSISPNTYVNTGWAPFSYQSNNPKLKCEEWTSYDAQFTFHGDKIGLLSLTGFYKTVENKIWSRTYQRIKGDPLIDPFPNTAAVNVTLTENHPYEANIKGIEFEWQTSFFYLPKPFNFFTLYANYTYSQSKTTYPYTDIRNVTPPGGGRPTPVRVDSTISGPLLYQPQSIANFSLGFNYKGFNAWISYQYNGLIYTGVNYHGVTRLDSQKEHFNRWDLQLTQKFKIAKVSGFEVIANIANLTNFNESNRLRGDPRLTYQEKFGLTADLGVRYRF
jgi:TonB-dependent receptor